MISFSMCYALSKSRDSSISEMLNFNTVKRDNFKCRLVLAHLGSGLAVSFKSPERELAETNIDLNVLWRVLSDGDENN